MFDGILPRLRFFEFLDPCELKLVIEIAIEFAITSRPAFFFAVEVFALLLLLLGGGDRFGIYSTVGENNAYVGG